MNTYLITGGTILSFDSAAPVLTDHAILVEDGLIKRIAPASEFDTLDLEVIDAAGKVIMPGLINAHHHFYSTLVRGLGKAAPSKDFNEVLENLWWRLDKKLVLDDVYVSAMVSIFDGIRHGTTTIIDHHASPFAVTGSLARIGDAVTECGIRANLCYEVSDRDGAAISAEGIAENAAWIKAVNAQPNPMLKGLFGMHAAFTLGDDTLQKIADQVHSLNCGVHVHAAEAESDQIFNINHHGKRVIERFEDFGLINDKSIFAHGVYINPKEMLILAKHQAALVTNPQSNLNNAVGIADICKMSELGLLVGLGTDAMTVNMLEELRVGLWAQHWRQTNPSVGFMEIASTLLFNNPRIANRYWGNVGILKEGYAADIIMIDYHAPTPLDANTWIGHVIFGISQAIVDTTICNGNILMWNKQLTIAPDEAEIAAWARELATKLWERF
ncbi:MAG: chlorohydrolase [Candidatus Cloacimonetes bacterium HGW-Cloacimonetes-1]|jgi:putative selenium metabolism protein SsnA|nr:MAG: chlorohydrolase [Candidatus Cloacimonetes bacterium HGW-Cloacimonetes-1]